jgi:hypothetical protein
VHPKSKAGARGQSLFLTQTGGGRSAGGRDEGANDLHENGLML